MTLDITECSVYIATPCYGGMVTEEYAQNLVKTSMELNLNGVPCFVQTMKNESYISRGRMVLMADFMASDYTHLMFIDSDIGWESHQIAQLLIRDRDVIAGIYPKKMLPIKYVMNGAKEPEEDGCVEVSDAGTGFMMIKRHVIERLIAAHPELKVQPHIFDHTNKFGDTYRQKFTDNYYAIMDGQVRDGRLLTEDYSFCRRWQDLGGKIYVDPTIRLSHTGTYVFSETEWDSLKSAIKDEIIEEMKHGELRTA